MAFFVGQEIVYRREKPVWSMSFAGGVIPADRELPEQRAIYAFLRMALRQGTADQPYRGPSILRDDRYVYTNQSDGSLEKFSGHERIACDDQRVYELHYTGGVLR